MQSALTDTAPRRMPRRRIGLTTQIFFGLIAGCIIGYFFPEWSIGLKVFGDVFLRMIKMIVVPLIFASLIMGIAGSEDFKTLGRLGIKTLIWFELATTVALAVGMLIANLLQPGAGVSASGVGDTGAVIAASRAHVDMVQMLVDIVPTNIVESMARGSLLQIVFFSTFFGLAVAAAGDAGKPVLTLAESVCQVMFRFTGMVMRLAPIGIAATIAYTVGKFGLGMLLPLGKLILCLYAALAIFLLLLLVTVSVITRVNLFHLMRAIREPAVLAFSTAASETALPILMEKLEEFGVPRRIVMFVLPVGYSFNLDGGTLYASLAVVFIAQVYNVPLNLAEQFTLLLTLMLATKGMAAVPGAVLITIAGTAAAFGLPIEGVALILGIDRILDMGRTATNVVGNAVATVVVARWENALSKETLQLAYAKSYED